MISSDLPQSSLTNYESNDLLQKHFLRGWYISKNTCDEILHEFDQLHKANKTTHKDSSKTCHVAGLNEQFANKLCNQYLFDLSQAIKAYRNHFEWSRFNNLGPNGFAPEIQVEYYEPGTDDSMWRSERNMLNTTRNFFWITYLNDVQDDGETEFYYQKIRIKPRKGLTIISPAEWTHTHHSIPSKEAKYIVTGWLEHSFEYRDDLLYFNDILTKKNETEYT